MDGLIVTSNIQITPYIFSVLVSTDTVLFARRKMKQFGNLEITSEC